MLKKQLFCWFILSICFTLKQTFTNEGREDAFLEKMVCSQAV